MKTINSRISSMGLRNYVQKIFTSIGIAERDAETISDSLVAANLRGVDSHGVSRVPIYLERFTSNLVNTSFDIEVQNETATSALIDGKNSHGILVAQKAIEMAVEKAKVAGIAIIGVKESNHCGMLAYYSKYAVDHDCIAIITSNASPSMAPWGGRERYFGTNPLCYGIPVNEDSNIIFDMATSVVARGKIRLAAKHGKSIPDNWALTRDGEYTTDPLEALEGLVLPFGGPKGNGLVTLIDILSGVMTGANFGSHAGAITDEGKQGLGHTFIVIKADLFLSLDQFKNRMEQMIKEIKMIKKMKGIDRIYLPGEIEQELEERNKEFGIPLDPLTCKELENIGEKFNLNMLDYLEYTAR